MRIGMGYDVHRLVEDRRLIMGGVEIPYEKGLLGHSDADAALRLYEIQVNRDAQRLGRVDPAAVITNTSGNTENINDRDLSSVFLAGGGVGSAPGRDRRNSGDADRG